MRNPDLDGAAQAWDCNGLREANDKKPHGCISQWLVKGKFHAFWDHWSITVCHLRDVEGLPPAHKDSPDETHEFLIVALNPGDDANNRKVYDPDDLPEPLPFLMPPDCAVRFKSKSDAQATSICEAAVKMIVAGDISPDSDYRRFWKELILKTAECEKHPETNLN